MDAGPRITSLLVCESIENLDSSSPTTTLNVSKGVIQDPTGIMVWFEARGCQCQDEVTVSGSVIDEYGTFLQDQTLKNGVSQGGAVYGAMEFQFDGGLVGGKYTVDLEIGWLRGTTCFYVPEQEPSIQSNKFTMNIWTARWGHDEHCRIWKTSRGWKVELLDFVKETDKRASSLIAYFPSGEWVSPPRGLQDYFKELWEASNGMTDEDMQKHLDQLAKWISEAEKGKPEIHWLSKGGA